MLNLLSLQLTNYVLFKSASLDLSYKGVTVVYGSNKQSGMSGYSNGSGKSLLLSSIPQLLYRNTAVSSAVGARAKKDALSDKSFKSTIDLTFNDDNHTYGITAHLSGSIEYVLTRDGKEARTRTVAYAQSKIAKVFPITESEFYSLVYLDSRRPSELQFGTPVSRLSFFTDLFRLDDYDEVKRLFNVKLRDLKDDRIVLAELDKEYSVLSESTANLDVEELQASLKQLHVGSAENLKKQKIVQHRISVLMTTSQHFEEIESLRTNAIDLGLRVDITETGLTGAQNTLSNMQREIKRQLAVAESWEHYKNALAEWRGKRKLLMEQQTRFGMDNRTAGKLSDYIDKVSRHQHEQMAKQKSQTQQLSALNLPKPTNADASKMSFDVATDRVLRVSTMLDTQTAMSTSYAESIKLLSSLSDDSSPTCPLCKTDLSHVGVRSLIACLDAALIESQSSATNLRNRLKRLHRLLEYYAKNNVWEAQQEEILAIQDSLDAVNDRLLYLEKLDVTKLRRVLRLKQQLEDLDKPSPPDTKSDAPYRELKKRADTIQEVLGQCRLLAPVVRLFDEVDVSKDQVPETIAKYRLRLTKFVSEYDTLFSKIPNLQSQLDLQLSYHSRMVDIEARRREIQGRLEDYPIYEMLIEAYSNKGVKLILIRNIAKMVEANLNKYAGLLYSEPFQFEFKVDVNQCDILVHRRYGDKVRTSDIRTLSGAESRFFNFLFPLSVLPLVPSKRRCSTIILDEPTTNMDANARDLFITRFIPQLNTLIPSIIIITPQDTEFVEGARVVRVVKSGGSSTLDEVK